MHLVVGLGNPGPKYADHRHNVGFMVVGLGAERLGASAFRAKHRGELTRVVDRGSDVLLLRPMTFMNRSGESVRETMAFFRVPLERVVVVHDELDLPFGEVRVKVGGGLAGHNGLKSIAEHGGGNGFVRVRVGIGRPVEQKVESFVLSSFSADERARLGPVLETALDAVLGVVTDGADKTMQRLHTRGPRAPRDGAGDAPDDG